MKALFQATAPLLILLILSYSGIAQNTTEAEKPYIEVTGKAEKEITPDKIYLFIHLQERPDGKEKVSIERLEKDLQKGLSDAGIDVSKLTLSDASSSYEALRRKKRDVIARKQYRLLLTKASEVSKVFKVCDELDIEQVGIERLDHSKMTQYRKEVRIQAMKAAKDKANYMLGAIGEVLGSPLVVRESSGGSPYRTRNAYANAMVVGEMDMRADDYEAPDVNFRTIKLTSQVYIKYSIATP